MFFIPNYITNINFVFINTLIVNHNMLHFFWKNLQQTQQYKSAQWCCSMKWTEATVKKRPHSFTCNLLKSTASWTMQIQISINYPNFCLKCFCTLCLYSDLTREVRHCNVWAAAFSLISNKVVWTEMLNQKIKQFSA